MERFCGWVWRFRWATWVVVGLVALGLSFVPPIQFDQSIEGFFPDDHEGLAQYQKTRGLFGEENMVFVAYEDPDLWSPEGMDRLADLAAAIGKDKDGIDRVESMDAMPLPWRVDEAVETIVVGRWSIMKLLGARATVGDAFRFAGGEEGRNATLRERICSHPLFEGLMVDSAGTMTTVVVSIKDAHRVDHKAVVRRIRETADAFAKKHGFAYAAVAGPPVLFSDGFVSLEEDNRVLGFVAMVLMAATMFVAVRNPGWALLPLIAGWTTWQLVRFLLWKFDLQLTLSSGPIVAQTVVLCMPPAAHLAMRFREFCSNGLRPEAAARTSLSDACIPVAWCAATAASGYFAGWLASDVRPVSQFGMTMCVSNLAAGFLAFVLSGGSMGLAGIFRRRNGGTLSAPPSISNDLDGKPRETTSAPDPSHKPRTGRVNRLIRRVVDHPGAVVLAFVVPGVIAATGMARLKLESNYINIFRPNSRVAVDYRRAEAKLGGIGLIEVVMPAPAEASVAWLHDVQEAAAAIKAADPDVVAEVFSIADLLLPYSTDGMSAETVEGVVQRKHTFLGFPRFRYLLDRIWNTEAGATRLIVRIQESAPAEQKDALLHHLDEWAAAQPAGPKGQPTFVTGLSYLMTQITQAMIATSFRSAGWSTLLILAMLFLALRHVPLAVLALLPTVVAVLLVLGVMGWIGLKIDMSTALVAAVAIGLSVDDTFHCLLHWQGDLRQGLPVREAILESYATSGPGVILGSAAVTLGFLAMIFSQFVPMMNFGWLVAVATLGGSLGNLIMLPAVLSLTSNVSRRWVGWYSKPG